MPADGPEGLKQGEIIMTDTLTLSPSGDKGCEPSPDPWEPEGGTQVKIKNDSGYDQTLWDISPGLLNPAPGHEINIAKDKTWKGHVGNDEGDYKYDDGLASTGPRSGTIDPS